MVRIHQRWDFTTVRAAALALAREVERRARGDGDLEVVEGGAPAGRRVRRLQPERQGPHGRGGLLDPPGARRARRLPRCAGTRCPTASSATSASTPCPERLRTVGRPERDDRLDRGVAGLAARARAPDAEERGSSRRLALRRPGAGVPGAPGTTSTGASGADEAVAAIGLQEYPPGWGALAALRARSPRPAARRRRAGQRVPRLAVRRAARGRADLHGGARARGRGGAEGAGRRRRLRRRSSRRGTGCGEALDRWSPRRRATGSRAGRWIATRSTRRCASGCPTGLLPWCRGCQSHHVRPGFWRALGPLEVTVMPEKATWALAEPPRDGARGRARRAGAAVPARLRAGDAHAARVVGADRAVAREAAVRGDRRTSSSRPRSRAARVRARRGRRAADVAAGGVGRAPARRPRPLRRAARPRDARAGRRRCGSGCSRRSAAPARCSPTACSPACGAAASRATCSRSAVEWLGEPVDVAEEAEAIARLRDCEARLV